MRRIQEIHLEVVAEPDSIPARVNTLRVAKEVPRMADKALGLVKETIR